MFARITALMILVVGTTLPTHSQERFSLFVASTPESVERMLTLARLRDDDVVMDLGSGDGLIPLTAARMNSSVRGRGVDIDPMLVEQANERARSEGVADRVRFEHRNAFDADLRDVTVVTMWLYPELMSLLRPIILERARPGTRVVTSTWSLGSWQPDEVNNEGTPIYMWIVPARIAGSWDWELNLAGRRFRYASVIDQHFQKVEGVVRTGVRRELLNLMTLRGSEVTFTVNVTLDGVGLTSHEFSGTVNGDQIVGTVKVTPTDQSTVTLPWRARRTERSAYFKPTGTDMFQPSDH